MTDRYILDRLVPVVVAVTDFRAVRLRTRQHSASPAGQTDARWGATWGRGPTPLPNGISQTSQIRSARLAGVTGHYFRPVGLTVRTPRKPASCTEWRRGVAGSSPAPARGAMCTWLPAFFLWGVL